MRIVLVDDEETIRKGMIYLLDQLEMDIKIVGQAKNGREGLDRIEQLQPDYVFIDIQMPVMDGLELARILHERNSSPLTKRIILTAHSDFEYAQKAIRYDISDFLLKPLDEDVLLKMFARLHTATNKPAERSGSIGLQWIEGYIRDQNITHPVVTEILVYIGKNYMKYWQLNDLAKPFNLSSTYISTLFKKVTDENLIAFLNRFRVEMAKLLIEQRRYKINEIAYLVGYNNIAYFDRVFKTVTGMTPNEYYRQKHINSLD